MDRATRWSSHSAYSEPTRYVGQERRAHCVGRDDRYGWYQGKLLVLSTPARRAGRWAAAGPSVSDCGTHRNSEQARESEPGTPVASNPQNALQNEGQGLSRLAEGRPPRVWRGADWGPPGLPACWRCDIESNYDPTAARSEVNRRCFAIGFSSVQNRLAVMCRPIEGGGGLVVLDMGAAGLHRG